MKLVLKRLPNPNLLVNRFNGRHPMTITRLRHAEAERWCEVLLEALNGDATRFVQPVTITVTVQGAGNRIDVPNWLGHLSWKVLIDCLTEPRGNKTYGMGILVDDSPRYIKAMSVQVKPLGEPQTILEITEP